MRPIGKFDKNGKPLVIIIGMREQREMPIREARELLEDHDDYEELGRQVGAEVTAMGQSTIKPVGLPHFDDDELEDDFLTG